VVSTGTGYFDAQGRFIVTTDIGPYFGNHAFTLWSNVRYL
jgi:hypothetical protein